VTVEFRVLGPLEASVDGRPAELGGARQRAVLAILLATPGEVVPASRLIDDVWGEDPPGTAANLLQGCVSHLRRALGKDAIETRGSGYAVVADEGALDLALFERHAGAGARELSAGRPEAAAGELRAALALWRGPALADLADEPFARPIAARLDELRLAAQERALEADLARGLASEVAAELESLVAKQPLRERLRALQMLALYRSGRQADALAAFRAMRATLVEELGIEPGAELVDLERAILRQDPGLIAPGGAAAGSLSSTSRRRAVVAAALGHGAAARLAAIGGPLASAPGRELVLTTTVADAGRLSDATAALRTLAESLEESGVAARAAAFTSVAPGADLARLVAEQDADLLLVDAPDGLLEDARVLALLDGAPCDVAIVAGGEPHGGEGPVAVPFSGAGHDWAAVELGAWLAHASGCALQLVGASTGPGGRDASRLLANASLAVQRALEVSAEPVIVEPATEALVAVAAAARVTVVGLTERWRREGLGRTRTALATAPGATTLLVRRGIRPGGLAGAETDTRFTWTIAPAVG